MRSTAWRYNHVLRSKCRHIKGEGARCSVDRSRKGCVQSAEHLSVFIELEPLEDGQITYLDETLTTVVDRVGYDDVHHGTTESAPHVGVCPLNEGVAQGGSQELPCLIRAPELGNVFECARESRVGV